ncbi:NK-tumor recognition protein-like [Procambarus clarkii]|uniref:NK-tumor recognition protein-like n=1 Tax=Procambarus clarkii TaxID=6728 RepID=UPI003742FE06
MASITPPATPADGGETTRVLKRSLETDEEEYGEGRDHRVIRSAGDGVDVIRNEKVNPNSEGNPSTSLHSITSNKTPRRIFNETERTESKHCERHGSKERTNSNEFRHKSKDIRTTESGKKKLELTHSRGKRTHNDTKSSNKKSRSGIRGDTSGRKNKTKNNRKDSPNSIKSNGAPTDRSSSENGSSDEFTDWFMEQTTSSNVCNRNDEKKDKTGKWPRDQRKIIPNKTMEQGDKFKSTPYETERYIPEKHTRAPQKPISNNKSSQIVQRTQDSSLDNRTHKYSKQNNTPTGSRHNIRNMSHTGRISHADEQIHAGPSGIHNIHEQRENRLERIFNSNDDEIFAGLEYMEDTIHRHGTARSDCSPTYSEGRHKQGVKRKLCFESSEKQRGTIKGKKTNYDSQPENTETKLEEKEIQEIQRIAQTMNENMDSDEAPEDIQDHQNLPSGQASSEHSLYTQKDHGAQEQSEDKSQDSSMQSTDLELTENTNTSSTQQTQKEKIENSTESWNMLKQHLLNVQKLLPQTTKFTMNGDSFHISAVVVSDKQLKLQLEFQGGIAF